MGLKNRFKTLQETVLHTVENVKWEEKTHLTRNAKEEKAEKILGKIVVSL